MLLRVIKWAEKYDGPLPFALPKPKRACGVAGLRYEHAVAKRTEGLCGQWWRYKNGSGSGENFCQTDIVMLLNGEAIVIEVKLTEVSKARSQLALYVPVVAMALRKPTKGIVVCRHLSRESERSLVRENLASAMRCASERFFPTVHWMGKGPL